jgi:hypothetical protein
MRKKLTIENVLTELKEVKKTVDVGYPWYNVPETIGRAIRLLERIKKECGEDVFEKFFDIKLKSNLERENFEKDLEYYNNNK